jgi:hypothetical protein
VRAQKRDANELGIVQALREAGWLVLYLDKFDLLLWHPTRRQLRMVEVKTPTGKLKPSQEKLLADGWPLEIIRTKEDALR